MNVIVCIFAVLWMVIAAISLCPFRKRAYSENA